MAQLIVYEGSITLVPGPARCRGGCAGVFAFEAVALQLIPGILILLILDGGTIARICGIPLIAFWGGVVVLIWRHPQSPSRTDIELIHFGYLPVAVLASFLVQFIWHLRGLR